MPFANPEDRRRYHRKFYAQPSQRLKRSDSDRAWYRRLTPEQRADRFRRETFKRFLRMRADRERLLIRDDFTCHYCGFSGWPKQLTIDHKIPRVRGGEDTDENRVTACWKCNTRKGTKSYEQFMAQMQPDAEPDWVMEEN